MKRLTQLSAFLLLTTLLNPVWALMPGEQLEASIINGTPFTGRATDKNGNYKTPATLFLKYDYLEDGERQLTGVLQWDDLGTVNLIEGDILRPLGSAELVFSETFSVLKGEAKPGVRYLIRPEFDGDKLVLTGVWAEPDGTTGRIKLSEAPDLKGSTPSLLQSPFVFFKTEIQRWNVRGLRMQDGSQQANLITRYHKNEQGHFEESKGEATLVFSDIPGQEVRLCVQFDDKGWEKDAKRIDTLWLSLANSQEISLPAEEHKETRIVCTLNNFDPMFRRTGRLGLSYIGRTLKQSEQSPETVDADVFLGNFTVRATGDRAEEYKDSFNASGLDVGHFLAKAVVLKANVARYGSDLFTPAMQTAIANYSEAYMKYKNQ